MICTVALKTISWYDKFGVDGISYSKMKVKLQGIKHKHDSNLELASDIEDIYSIFQNW